MPPLDRKRASGSITPRGEARAHSGGSLIDPRTLMRIKSLQIRARVAVEGFIKGIHRSPLSRILGRVQRVPRVQPGR